MSLTIHSDLHTRPRQPGLNASQVAGEAPIHEVARPQAEQLQAEIEQDLAAVGSYMATHGSLAALVREHDPAPEGPR